MNFFNKLKKNHPNIYVVIIAAAIVMFWRGIWGLLDIYLFPNNELLSYTTSIIIGICILLINDFRLNELRD